MDKINYVISTYNGLNKRNHSEPLPKDVLKTHLSKLLSLQHTLSQITIMKPTSETFYPEYYEVQSIIENFNIPIKIVDCENYGFSFGQFLTAYKKYTDQFDYYIFVEDDYVPLIDGFDTILTKIYTQKFLDKIGVLCSLVQGSYDYSLVGGYPPHVEGIVCCNSQTLDKIFCFPLWENDPIKWLDLIDSGIDSDYDWEGQKQGYKGGYYQLTFSYLFYKANILMDDYLDVKYKEGFYQFPYWQDYDVLPKGGRILFYDKGDIVRETNALKDYHYSLIGPIQIATNSGLKHHTGWEWN